MILRAIFVWPEQGKHDFFYFVIVQVCFATEAEKDLQNIIITGLEYKSHQSIMSSNFLLKTLEEDCKLGEERFVVQDGRIDLPVGFRGPCR